MRRPDLIGIGCGSPTLIGCRLYFVIIADGLKILIVIHEGYVDVEVCVCVCVCVFSDRIPYVFFICTTV